MLLLDLKHSGKLCEDLIIRGSNDGSNGNDTEAAPSPLGTQTGSIKLRSDLSDGPVIRLRRHGTSMSRAPKTLSRPAESARGQRRVRHGAGA